MAVKVLLHLGLNTFSDTLRERQVLLLTKHTFVHPLRLAAELHLYDILELLLATLLKMVREVLNLHKYDLGYSWEKIISTHAFPIAALDMAHHVERLCIHGAAWKGALRQTLQTLTEYGMLRREIHSPGRLMTSLHYCVETGNDEELVHLLID